MKKVIILVMLATVLHTVAASETASDNLRQSTACNNTLSIMPPIKPADIQTPCDALIIGGDYQSTLQSLACLKVVSEQGFSFYDVRFSFKKPEGTLFLRAWDNNEDKKFEALKKIFKKNPIFYQANLGDSPSIHEVLKCNLGYMKDKKELSSSFIVITHAPELTPVIKSILGSQYKCLCTIQVPSLDDPS